MKRTHDPSHAPVQMDRLQPSNHTIGNNLRRLCQFEHRSSDICAREIPSNETFCAQHKGTEGCIVITNGHRCAMPIATKSQHLSIFYQRNIYKCKDHMPPMPTERCDFVRNMGPSGTPILERCKDTRFYNSRCCRRHIEFETRLAYCEICALPILEHQSRCSLHPAPVLIAPESITITTSTTNSAAKFPDSQTSEHDVDRMKSAHNRLYSYKELACVVCGQLTNDCKEFPVQWLNTKRDMLKKHERIQHVPDEYFRYTCQELNDMVLESRGIVDKGGNNFMVNVCALCYIALKHKHLPTMALCNDNWSCSHRPAELCDLTWIEEKLIALAHLSVNLIKCTKYGDDSESQQSMRGNVYTYPADPGRNVNSLPLPIDQLNGLVKVVFTSKLNVTRAQCSKYKFYVVRRDKVTAALRWLKQNNPLYRNVIIDEAVLATLPSDGIPEQVYDLMTMNRNVAGDARLHSRPSNYTSHQATHETNIAQANQHANTNLNVSSEENPPATDEPMQNEISMLIANEVIPHPQEPDNPGPSQNAMDVDSDEPDNTSAERHLAELPNFEMYMETSGAVDCDGNTIPVHRRLLESLRNVEPAQRQDPIETDTSNLNQAIESDASTVNQTFESNATTLDQPEMPSTNVDTADDLVVFSRLNNDFESEYCTEHLMKAYPTLFPFGIGGVKILHYDKRVHCLLKQSSRYFAEHVSFCFITFNVSQKRKICLAARAFCETSRLTQIMDLIDGMNFSQTAQLLNAAARSHNTGHDNLGSPAMTALQREINTRSRNIVGSRSFCDARKQEMKSIFGMFGMPALWITINPSPKNHLLMMELCGQSLEEYLQLPTETKAKLVKMHLARNPVAQAEFFDHLIMTFLEEIVGVKNDPIGIFGEVNAYYFMTEAQGCGNLHAHGLVWLKHVPNPIEFYERLRDTTFRDKVIKWIDKFVLAGFDHLYPATVEARPIDVVQSENIDYLEHMSHFEPQTENDFMELARDVAIRSNYHRHTATCYKKGKTCRFMFGKEGKQLEPHTKVNDQGDEIILKRTHAWANSYNPHTSQLLLGNNDFKFLPAQSSQSSSCYMYIANYATKCPDESTDAVVFKEAVVHVARLSRTETVQDPVATVRKLLQKIGFAREAGKLICGSQVCMNLLGKGNKGVYYTNCQFQWLYFGALVRTLQPQADSRYIEYAALTKKKRVDAIRTYQNRPTALEHESLYTFVAKYELKRQKNRSKNGQLTCDILEGDQTTRIVIELRPTPSIPVTIGPTIPHSTIEDDDAILLRMRCLIVLLKPWRTVEELRETTLQSFAQWESQCRESTDDSYLSYKQLLSNFDAQARSKADARKQAEYNKKLQQTQRPVMYNYSDENDDDDDQAYGFESLMDPLDFLLNRYQTLSCQNQNQLSAIRGIREAQLNGILIASVENGITQSTQNDSQLPSSPLPFIPPLSSTTINNSNVPLNNLEPQTFKKWQKALTQLGHLQTPSTLNVDPYSQNVFTNTFRANDFLNSYALNDDQARVVLKFIDHHQKGRHATPFRDMLCGEGGTGKSRVIKCIVDFFDKIHCSHELLVSGTTGVAAGTVDGGTVHSTVGLRPSKCEDGCERSNKEPTINLMNRWNSVKYLIIDEMSMLSLQFLMNKLKPKLGVLKQNAGCLYGGLCVLFSGDFNQLPPVGGTPLYRYIDFDLQRYNNPNEKNLPDRDIVDLSREFWTAIDDVYILKENHRITEPSYCEFLRRVRTNQVTDDDIKYLNSRIISNPEMRCHEWDNALLILTRNALRTMWNNTHALQHAHEQHRQVIISPAFDQGASTVPLTSRILLDDNDTEGMPTWLPLVINEPLMVTKNIAIGSGLANGSIVTLKHIILDDVDTIDDNNSSPVILLRKPPKCLIVKLSKERDSGENTDFPELEPNCVPLFPAKQRVELAPHQRVTRTQYRLTPAYALTDFKVQGQQYKERVLFDFATSGKVNAQAMYVMCSRITKFEDMAVLRPFNPAVFQPKKQDNDLLAVHEKLEKMREQTIQNQGPVSIWMNNLTFTY